MKTLAQAIAIAEALNGGQVDHGMEYDDAWLLMDRNAPMTLGGHSGCYYVMKADDDQRVLDGFNYRNMHNFNLHPVLQEEFEITEEHRKG